jgi:membrane associated rhomboid family serine protease
MRPLRQQFQSFNRSWPGRRFSVVAMLIGANVGLFLFQTLVEAFAPGWTTHWLALSGDGIRSGFEWQFLTYMFLHGGVMHLLFNMLTLYFAGRELEVIAGRNHLLGIYFGGGIVGGIAQVMLSNPHMELVGASAGVCAALIAFTTIYPEMELTLLLFFVIPVRLKAKYLALGLVGTSILFSISGVWGSVGHLAHLGGCVVGWVYARQLGFGRPLAIQRYFFKKRERLVRMEKLTPEQFISEEIDPILDKISREGIHSLTRAERKILEKGREKIAKKTSGR